MKKTLLFPVFLLLLVIAKAQNVVIKDSVFTATALNQTPKLMSVGTTEYNADCSRKSYSYAVFDNFTNTLTDFSKELFDYYPDGSLYHTITQIKYTSSSTYTNSTRETFTYTAAKAIASDLNENWNGTDWVPAGNILYTYNTAGKLTGEVFQSSDGITPLVNVSETLTPYDASGHLQKTENLIWDAASATWIPQDEIVYTYDASGFLIKTVNEDWDAALQAWQQRIVTTLYNNSGGLPDSSLMQYASNADSVNKSYFTYNASVLSGLTSYTYENNAITNGYRATFFHDSANYIKRDSTVTELYNVATSSFTLQYYSVLTNAYNTDNMLPAFISATYFPSFRLYVYTKQSFGYGACSGVVPVTLLSFSGREQNNNALLSWQTANETNTSYFNIQRSYNGVYFTTIGKVKAAGSSVTQQSYTYTDADIHLLNVPKLYYRLATTDNDGSVAYSKTAELNVAAGKLTVYISPNPVGNTVVIRSPYLIEHALVSISDMSGKTVYTSQQTIAAAGTVTIDASRFARGTYVVTIQSAANRQVFKIVK